MSSQRSFWHIVCLFFVLRTMALADDGVETVDYPTASSEVLLDWDSSWLFWADEDPPPEWPLVSLPTTDDALSLLPETRQSPDDGQVPVSSPRSDSDRVYVLRDSDDSLTTRGMWWSGTHAPYSAFTERVWLENHEDWERSRRRQQRRNNRQFSRTQLVFPSGPLMDSPSEEAEQNDDSPIDEGLRNLYFARSFEVDDPTRFQALRIQARFNKGIQIFVNGERVVINRLHMDQLEHGDFAFQPPHPDFVWPNVGYNDRWQYHWDAIPAELLRSGENVISVVIHRLETSESPAMYFDLRLQGWTEHGWATLPYLHAVTQNEVTVSWETTIPTTGTVEVREVGTDRVTEFLSGPAGPHHEVRITGLEANTTYRYQVIGNPNSDDLVEDGHILRSEEIEFTTAPPDDSAFAFLFYGDSRYGASIHRALADLMRADHEIHETNVVLHAGDLVSTGYSRDLWHDRFFAPAHPLISRVPIYPTPGNHEVNQRLYYDYFDLPHNESWYHFRYGIADFYSINTNVDFEPGSEQYEWLDDVLSESEATWKIALFHHPPFACANGRKSDGGEIREHLVPLLEAHGVDLALLGHDHVYGRSHSINGVTYVISGGGGSPLYESSTDEYMAVCETVYNYTRFHVEEDAIRWVAIDEEGTLIDEFTIVR